MPIYDQRTIGSVYRGCERGEYICEWEPTFSRPSKMSDLFHDYASWKVGTEQKGTVWMLCTECANSPMFAWRTKRSIE